jgi:hypothetical protein
MKKFIVVLKKVRSTWECSASDFIAMSTGKTKQAAIKQLEGMIPEIVGITCKAKIQESKDGIFELTVTNIEKVLKILQARKKKFKIYPLELKAGKRDNLQINLDFDFNPLDPYPVFLFTPNMEDTNQHYHISLNKNEAKALQSWLTKYIQRIK